MYKQWGYIVCTPPVVAPVRGISLEATQKGGGGGGESIAWCMVIVLRVGRLNKLEILSTTGGSTSTADATICGFKI